MVLEVAQLLAERLYVEKTLSKPRASCIVGFDGLYFLTCTGIGPPQSIEPVTGNTGLVELVFEAFLYVGENPELSV